MTDYTRDEELRARYGDINTQSGPVDPAHPTFDSLLGALQAVHTGQAGMDVLASYHRGLSEQLEVSRQAITGLLEPDEVAEAARLQKRMSLSSLALTKTMLDSLARYIKEPTADNMATCVDLLLQAQRVVRDVRVWLDEHLRQVESEGQGSV